ncbi:hypothetical protein [Glaciimonas sp. GG7]
MIKIDFSISIFKLRQKYYGCCLLGERNTNVNEDINELHYPYHFQVENMKPTLSTTSSSQASFNVQNTPPPSLPRPSSRVAPCLSGAHPSTQELRNEARPAPAVQSATMMGESHASQSLQSAYTVKQNEDGEIVPTSPVKVQPENHYKIGQPTRTGVTFSVFCQSGRGTLKAVSTKHASTIEVTTFTPAKPTQSTNSDTR